MPPETPRQQAVLSASNCDTSEAALRKFLRANGLVADPATAILTPLAGGVASDIFRVEHAGGALAVKRALGKLRVEQDWQVPTERNAQEVAWLELASRIVPGAVPQVLAHDPASGMFAMTYLDPARHPVWKQELSQGRAEPGFAASVGRTLAAIHAATAHDQALAARFANQTLFSAIRLDPYLGAAAALHPDLAPALRALAAAALEARIALVHGDVSPKNILHGPAGPVLLDAECACYGDPAFDAAFCLNHLLLKCLWVPRATAALLTCYDAFAAAWLAGAGWEHEAGLERRTARLLPALMLARIDGKSPVEYITSDAAKSRVRGFARAAIQAPADSLQTLRDAWRISLGRSGGLAHGARHTDSC